MHHSHFQIFAKMRKCTIAVEPSVYGELMIKCISNTSECYIFKELKPPPKKKYHSPSLSHKVDKKRRYLSLKTPDIEHTLYLDSVTVSLFVLVKRNQRKPNNKSDFETEQACLKIHPLSTGRVGGLRRIVGGQTEITIREQSQTESTQQWNK